MKLYESLSQLSAVRMAVAVLTLYVAYGLSLAVYRLYLSPLSKYPGPKLTAITLWYEFYYDVIKRGRFSWEIRRMHEIYGKRLPITASLLPSY